MDNGVFRQRCPHIEIVVVADSDTRALHWSVIDQSRPVGTFDSVSTEEPLRHVRITCRKERWMILPVDKVSARNMSPDRLPLPELGPVTLIDCAEVFISLRRQEENVVAPLPEESPVDVVPESIGG